VAIVTGGSAGIGCAASVLFAERGAKVVIAGRTKEPGEETVAYIRDQGGDTSFVACDVSKAQDEGPRRGTPGGRDGAPVRDYASGIRVTVISPSTIDSPTLRANPGTAERLASATPIARVGNPREVAEAVVWLCSDAASYVTGTVLPVVGGMTARGTVTLGWPLT
jgi:NAD(P)-dependent dehydrogenase (short-subunit alcohol dehydrogenase family)